MTAASRTASRRAAAPARHAPADPRFALGWAALVYALCTLALGYQALAGRFLVNPNSDQYFAGYAFREFGASYLHQTGGFPLWNPYIFSGLPYVAAMHGDIFYPTFLLRMALPTDVAMTWSFIVHVFLAGLFTYLFLRAWRFGFYASLTAGVCYLMSGSIAGLISPGHDGKLYVATLFPLTLLLVLRGMRDGRNWAWGALALDIGLAVLSPHPQLLQYLLLAAGAFSLFLAFTTREDGIRLERSVALKRLGVAALMVLLGFAIGAIQFLPVREYVPWSPRSGGRGYEYATSFSLPPEEIINFYLPQFTGILGHYWGRNRIHLHSDYFGVIALFLAGAGLTGDTVRRNFRRFWIGLFVVALVWAMGGYTPFYHIIYALIPGTKFFRAPSTILYLVAFATAMLVALGTERMIEGRLTQRYAFGWIITGAAIALLASVGGLTGIAQAIAEPGLYERVAANGSQVVVGSWRSFLFVMIAAALLLLALRGRITPRTLGWGLAIAAALDLWSIERLYWPFSAPASVLYATDPTIDYIKRQPQPGRVFAAPLSADFAPHDPNLAYDGLMVHRIRTATGYHGNELGRYDILGDMDGGWIRALASPGFWQIANVRYLLTNVPSLPTGPGAEALDQAKRVVGPVKDAAGSTVYLYELPGDNPAAWVVPVIVKAPDDAILATIYDRRFDARRYALVDTSSTLPASTITAPPEPLAIHATVERYEPGDIRLRLDAPAPAGAALMVSENYYPGWQATVDGKPATVGRADYTFMAVPLPAGARAVTLRFQSDTYRTGKYVTIAALALSILLIAGGAAMDRRHGGAGGEGGD